MKNLVLLASLSTAFCTNTFAASCVNDLVDALLCKKPLTSSTVPMAGNPCELFNPVLNTTLRDLFNTNFSNANTGNTSVVIAKINALTCGSIAVNASDSSMSINGSKVQLIWGASKENSKLVITRATSDVCENAQSAKYLMRLIASGLNPIATSDYKSISDIMRNWWYKKDSWSLELSPYTGELPICHVHPSSLFTAQNYRDAVRLTESWTMQNHGEFNSAWSIFRVKDATEEFIITELSKLIAVPDIKPVIRGTSTYEFIRQIVRSCQMRTWLEYESEGCVWVKKSSDSSLSSLDKKAILTALMSNAHLYAQYILYTNDVSLGSTAYLADQLYGSISSIAVSCIGMTEYTQKKYEVLKEEWHDTPKFVDSWNSKGDWETILIPEFVMPNPVPDDSAQNIFLNYAGNDSAALTAIDKLSYYAISNLRPHIVRGDISISWGTPPVLRIGALKYGEDPNANSDPYSVLGLLNTLRMKANLAIDTSTIGFGTEADIFKWWALHNDAVGGMYLRTPATSGVSAITAFSPVLPVLKPNNVAVNIFNNYQALNNYLVAIQPSIAPGDIAQQSFLKFVRALDAATNGAFTRLTDLTMPVPKISNTGITIGNLKPGMNAAYARAAFNDLINTNSQYVSAFRPYRYVVSPSGSMTQATPLVLGDPGATVQSMLNGWVAGSVGNIELKPTGGTTVPTRGTTVPTGGTTVPTGGTTVPPTTVPIPIPTLRIPGYFPLEIINRTGREDSEVYFFIRAQEKVPFMALYQDSVLSLDSDLEPSTRLPKMSAQLVTLTTDLSQYNYAFSRLPKTLDGRRILLVSLTGTSVFTGLSETYYQLPKYAIGGQTTLQPGDLGYMLPPTIYGRVYFSVGRPMFMQAKVYDNDRLLIGDPDGFNPTDPNYYTLYDKVEYVATAGRTRINPTSVDFVSLPIQVEQQDATSVIKSAGFAGARTTIFNTIKDTLSSEWSKLVLHSGDTDLRIMAPGKAMVGDMTGVNPSRFYTQYPYPSATAIDGSELYSQALHKAAGESPVYTFAYNNYQAQDGILTYSDGRAEDLIIPSSNALTPDLARITIGDLTGVVTPTSGGTTGGKTVPTGGTTVPTGGITVPTVPTQVEGYFPLEIINGTKRSDLEVYVFIKAAQEKLSSLEFDKDCVLSLDSATEPSSGLPKMSVQLITTAGDVSQYN
ncbi:MAG: beta-1,3-glucanase family protein, partial [Alphaproteobacteria bacterium]